VCITLYIQRSLNAPRYNNYDYREKFGIETSTETPSLCSVENEYLRVTILGNRWTALKLKHKQEGWAVSDRWRDALSLDMV